MNSTKSNPGKGGQSGGMKTIKNSIRVHGGFLTVNMDGSYMVFRANGAFLGKAVTFTDAAKMAIAADPDKMTLRVSLALT